MYKKFTSNLYQIPQKDSNSQQNFEQATAAERGYWEIPIFSSTQSSAKLSVPWAIAPIAIQIDWSGGIVGKYRERRTGWASYESANQIIIK